MYIRRTNYTDETDTDNYIEFQLGTTCSIQLIPQPLRSCQDQKHKSFFHLKDCPGRQGLFQISEKSYKTDFGKSGKDIKVSFKYQGKLLQPFDGLVTYRDTILYEGRRISSANLPVDLMLEEEKTKVLGLDLDTNPAVFGVTEGHQVTVERPDHNDPKVVIVHISFVIKKALPGFYTFNTKLMDDFFQPYVEFNSVFRMESDVNAPEFGGIEHKQWLHDQKLRKMFSHTLFEQTTMDNHDLLRWRNRARINLIALRKSQYDYDLQNNPNGKKDFYLEPIALQQAKLEWKQKKLELDGIQEEISNEQQDEKFESKLRDRAIKTAEKRGLEAKEYLENNEAILKSIMQEMRYEYQDLKESGDKTIEEEFLAQVENSQDSMEDDPNLRSDDDLDGDSNLMDGDSLEEILDKTRVNWRFRNIEETHADRWKNDATRMLDEIVVHQQKEVDDTKKRVKWYI